MIVRRKLIWLMILMVWVGMVTSIVIYQGSDYFDVEQATSENVEIQEGVEIVEQEEVRENSESNNINYTQSKNEEENKDFFIEYRLEREKARSEQISIFREMINNPNIDEATRKEAQNKMLALTDTMEKEMEIESLIRARGYKDALAYIHDEAVDVIIHTNGLEKDDVAKIGDIIIKVTGFGTGDVTIIEKRLEE